MRSATPTDCTCCTKSDYSGNAIKDLREWKHIYFEKEKERKETNRQRENNAKKASKRVRGEQVKG